MRLLLLADFHLGARLADWGNHVRKRREEIRTAWKEAVDAALSGDNGVDAVLIAGDLFDTPCPEKEDLTPVLEGLKRLAEAGKPVMILAGYFDGAYHPGCVYNQDLFPDSITRITWSDARCLEIPVGDETLHLYSRAPLPDTENQTPAKGFEKSDEPGFHVGLFYEVPESESPRGAWRPAVDREALEALELDLAVLGGYHNFEEQTLGQTRVVSPGTPVGLRPGEWDDRFWVFAQCSEDGVTIEKQTRRAPSVRKITKALGDEGIEDAQTLIEELGRENNADGMLVVELQGEVGTVWDPEGTEEKCKALPSAIVIEDQSSLASDWGILDDLKEDDSVEARFVREVRQSEDDTEEDGVVDGAIRLGLQEFRRVEGDHAS